MELSGDAITKAANRDDRKANWFTRPTHNNMRITRILRSMTLLGQHDTATRFLAALENLAAREPDCGVPADSMRFWRYAATLTA